VGALAANRKTAAMAQPAIAPQIHQPFDVHGHFAAQVTFHDEVAVDHLTDLQNFLITELGHPTRLVDVHLVHDLLGRLGPDSVDILKRDDDALVCRYVYTGDTGQVSSLLPPSGPAGWSKWL